MDNAHSLDSGTEELLCNVEQGVATITLNRPEKRNALSDALTPALREMLLTVEAAADVRCVVITGAGRAFCAGGDVSRMGDRMSGTRGDAAAARSRDDLVRELVRKEEALTLRLHELAKPTIAVLPGPAAGAGLSLALACDLRIAAASAFITTAFGNIGLSGDYGGTWFLTQLIGPSKAKELYFTSRRVSAEECAALGLVNEVVADDELSKRAREIAVEIASGPPIALRHMKANINDAIGGDLRNSLTREAERLFRCRDTEDHGEAVRAFLEKRQPQFRGA
jgi:enoyl-CoA hydratase/carnithine racemase